MNRATEGLEAQYATRFFITAAAVVGAAVSIQLVWLGKTGDHMLLTMGVAIVCISVAWFGVRDLHRRWVQLRQVQLVRDHGPYHCQEYVPPQEAGRQLADDNGPNMWSRR
jgi:hypothetical protein